MGLMLCYGSAHVAVLLLPHRRKARVFLQHPLEVLRARRSCAFTRQALNLNPDARKPCVIPLCGYPVPHVTLHQDASLKRVSESSVLELLNSLHLMSSQPLLQNLCSKHGLILVPCSAKQNICWPLVFAAQQIKRHQRPTPPPPNAQT